MVTTPSGFWDRGEVGEEEFAETNMNRTMLQVAAFTSLDLILDKEGMLGYDTTWKRFLTYEGGVITVIERVYVTTEALLPTFSRDHRHVLLWTSDTKILRHVRITGPGDDDFEVDIIAYSNISGVAADITEVTGADASLGTGTVIALKTHKHKHGEGIHVRGGNSEIDGDTIDIDFAPTNYARSTSPSQVTHAQELTAHLAGIDTALANAEAEC